MDLDFQNRMAGLLHHRKARLQRGDAIVPPLTLSATFHGAISFLFSSLIGSTGTCPRPYNHCRRGT